MIAEDTPIGSAVIVRLDGLDEGREKRTRTKSTPWWLVTRTRARRDGRRAAETKRLVVLLEGITGCYDCERVTLVSDRQLELFGYPMGALRRRP